MSLYGTLTVGVSGLQAQSNKIDILSTNLANTDTVGYKQSVASFADLIASDTVTDYSPGGVQGDNSQYNVQQGDISSASSPTDIAISGNGFFTVSQTTSASSGVLFTRAGSFTPDLNGNLVNGAGLYLQGWKLDANGNLPGGVTGASVDASAGTAALQPVNVQQLNDNPVPTSTATVQANLNAQQTAYAGSPPYDPTSATANMTSGSIQSDFNLPITAIDSKGNTHTLTAGFLKTGSNTWSVELYDQTSGDLASSQNPQVAAGTVTFNGDGSLASVSSSLTQPIGVVWNNGTSNDLSVNWGTAGVPFGTPNATVIGRTDGLSQLATTSNLVSVHQNGLQAGTLQSIAVTSDGFVAATYSNGDTKNLYKIPLAQFTDADQLQSVSGTAFSQTAAAGTLNFLQPGESNAGTLEGSSLESSNVDEASQLTDLIAAQSAYQFSTKLISTSDTMLQDLNQMGAT